VILNESEEYFFSEEGTYTIESKYLKEDREERRSNDGAESKKE
jgi:hypothetical protein